MQKLFLKFALLTGLFLVGLISPAWADEKDVYLDLTLKVSEYTGSEGGMVGMSGQNTSDVMTTAWLDKCNIRIESDNRGKTKYNDVYLYAKANTGYVFRHWADADSKTTMPAAATTSETVIYDGNFGYYVKRWLTQNPGVTATEGYKALFRYHVYGIFSDYHKDKYTLYAVFEPADYIVTFDAQGGTVSPATQTVKYKKPYVTLPTPTKTGYTFDGWFTAATDGTQVHPADTFKLTTAQTLYAHWTEKTYAIHFKDEESGSYNAIPDASYSLATTQMPNLATTTYMLTWNTDKYFAGYYTQPNGLGTRVYKGVDAAGNLEKDAAFTPTGETTLYAHYTHVHHNMYWDYTYAYLNSGSVAYKNVGPSDATSRIKYARLTFKNAAGAKIKSVILLADEVTNKDDAGLTADFATHTTSLANIKLSVAATPTAEGATVSSAAGVHNVYFSDADLAAFRSYTFEALDNTAAAVHANWVVATKKESHETILTYMGASKQENNYVQKWSVKLSGLLINPDVIYVMPLYEATTNNWDGISQLNHTIGVPCAKVSEVEGVATYNGSFQVWKGYNNAIGLVGFTLGGQTYYMNTSDQGVFSSNYNSAAPVLGTASVGTNNEIQGEDRVIEYTVPASAIPVIRFQANGGVLSASTPSYLVAAYNANVALSGYAATREHYTFQGWKTAASEGGLDVTSLTANKAYTLEAQWEGESHSVTLKHNDGTAASENVTAHYMAEMPSITAPTRAGYTFQGYWDADNKKYYNADCTGANVYDKTVDCDLYAGWKANDYTVSFDLNGAGSAPASVTATYGEPLADVTVPTWYGHAFLGYFDAATDGETVTKYFDAEGHCIQAWDKTSGATLYAHWETVEIILTANNEPNTANYYTTFYVSTTAYEVATADVTIYIATGVTDDFIHLEKITDGFIPADEAVLLQATQSEIHLVPVVSGSEKSENNLFMGVDTLTVQEQDYTYYVFGCDASNVVGFYKYEWKDQDGVTVVKGDLGAHKAFYRAENGSSQAAPRRYVFSHTDATTGMETAETVTLSARKMIMNGQLIIERDGKLYNAQGVMLN